LSNQPVRKLQRLLRSFPPNIRAGRAQKKVFLFGVHEAIYSKADMRKQLSGADEMDGNGMKQTELSAPQLRTEASPVIQNFNSLLKN
jgi:hypothetical protein